MNTVLLDHADGKTRTALLRDGKLFRFEEEEDGAHPRAEEIYYAKTDRCMPGMECVFVRLDAKTNAYLPYREMRGTPVPPKGGTGLIVQVKRSPAGEKLAYVTMDISLAGRYAVLLPGSSRTAVSGRTPESLRAAAEKRAASLRPDGFGLVLRSEGMEADEEEIRQEIGQLSSVWESIKAQEGGGMRLLYGRLSALERYLRDTKGGVDLVISDVPLDLSVPCEVRDGPMALYNVSSQREKALRRLHHLPGGGNIVIDPCEAMTVIDVNTAMDIGSRRGAEEARTRVNLEAAREIARLLQLRAVGGIILIDFIDMDNENNREAVKTELEKALETDPCKTAVHGFTSLGLMEMTRKKS